jgi:hypothetical protein
MKAIIIKTGLEVYIREEFTPKHETNKGMIAVSKKETGIAYFCINKEDLKIK